MTDEKNIDAEKKESQPQDKLTDEHLTDKQLDKVAGGVKVIEEPPELQGSPSGK